ncbi:MAG: trypsin-like peptidase domain-containing protein [Planctomycetes bacterium]|nr:trypsin-like peptidase domain-containing protein [Planctomycetota bacterium]
MTAYPSFPTRRSSAVPTIVAGAAFVLAIYLLLDRGGYFTPTPKAEPRAVTPRGDLAGLEQTFVEVFDRCSPSVASVYTSSVVYGRWGEAQQASGTGSGFVWDEAGTVVTNNHVVAGVRESGGQVQVSVGGRNYRATVVGTAPEHDLAVLRLVGNVGNLKPLLVGTSSDLRVGQTAIAIGNPFGFDQTMTTGIVSALNRTIDTNEGRSLHGLIQVDAAINRGNSGGPLLDSAGRLVGVTTAIFSPSGTSAGIGFAVPVDTVNAIVPRLLGGRSTTAKLGVRRLGDYVSYRLDPELGYTSGAIFGTAEDNFGAAAAGLRPFQIARSGRSERIEQYGDVIVAIDGKPVRHFDELGKALGNRKPGDTVKVTVVRGLPDAPAAVDVPVQLTAEGEGVRSGM